MGQGCGVKRQLYVPRAKLPPHALIRSAVGIKSLPPSAQLKLCEVGSPLGLAQKPGQGATQQTKLRNPVLQDTKLVHSHGRSQEESSVSSDLGKKKGMVGCRYQAPASWCAVRGVQNQEGLFTPDPLLLPTAPFSLLSHGHPFYFCVREFDLSSSLI